MLDKKDKLLLSLLQNAFPIDPQPYKIIARRLHLSCGEVMKRAASLRKRKVIRYIGAVLDTKKIGLKSSLVGMVVLGKRIPAVSRVINRYPEVTHNYLRDDEYNMWFTVSAATDAARSALIRRILKESKIRRYLDLATVKVFKIDARFRLDSGARQKTHFAAGHREKSHSLRGKKGRSLRINALVLAELARPLDLSGRPLQAIAGRLGVTQEAVAELIARCKQRKLIRRFGAVLDHYKIGLKTNALVAWQVDPKHIASVAARLSGVANISHCYWRKPLPGWPYSLYTMVHAASRRQCKGILTLILRSIGHTIKGSRILFTVKEMKKTRFDPERMVHKRYGTKKI
jgi:DNA-binding Lrp family transcriptional regulator